MYLEGIPEAIMVSRPNFLLFLSVSKRLQSAIIQDPSLFDVPKELLEYPALCEELRSMISTSASQARSSMKTKVKVLMINTFRSYR